MSASSVSSDRDNQYIRLCTKKYDNNCVEHVSIRKDNGIFYWKGSDDGILHYDTEIIWSQFENSFSFPVDLEFVKDFFEECGRILDVTKLPANYVEAIPYHRDN